ncbi:MAG: histidine kinase dimerization/phospho-acceptor domain-containing protein [Candidatus Accumulibacter necessarius]|jgi:two-component system osmolarity sensor histidine kinase EnvZ|uniref:histidine kinase dimerization/phospho-acceptor domain-containing protein n=1 Tax=Candidatus Accumulibacter necessarius TaxID=2954386 RepID=UPI002FC2D8D9
MLGQLASAAAERREMLAGLTHDLRAPLTRLRLRLALLESDLERAGLVRDIDDMERIVGQCLAFLRSEEHRPSAGADRPSRRCCIDEVARQRELGRPLER